MLETCRIGGVTCDRYTNILMMHNCNAFLYIVCTITFYSCTKSVRIWFFIYNVKFCFFVVIFCLNKSKSIDT